MTLQTVCIVLISQMALSASQSCGSISCSQEYSPGCPPDTSAYFYDNIMLNKSECNKPIGPPSPANSSSYVDCYDTCVKSIPGGGIILGTCADLVHIPGVILVENEMSNVIIRIHPPAVESNSYQLNKFCRYNIQCPNETYMLHYTVVQIDIEPPDANDQCLDFLRFNFMITGRNIISDLCGTHENLTDNMRHGFHGSHVNLDFRSNRIYSSGDFFLGMVCVLPEATVETTNKNSYNALRHCSSSTGFGSTNKLTIANEFLNKVFPGFFISRYDITVTRGGVVKYRNEEIVVEQNGRTLHRLRGIKRLQVHNRIEGYLNFVGSSFPAGRTFPGYGFLRVGRRRTGIAQYIQTIVDPKYLLTDAEEETVRKLFKEHYNRRKLDINYPKSRLISNKICGINRLAELNIASCSVVVRAVANFFLETDPFQDFCYPSIR